MKTCPDCGVSLGREHRTECPRWTEPPEFTVEEAHAHATEILRVNRYSAFSTEDACVVLAVKVKQLQGQCERLRADNGILLRVAQDMLSTYREDDKTTLVTAERQEAWKAEIERATKGTP